MKEVVDVKNSKEFMDLQNIKGIKEFIEFMNTNETKYSKEINEFKQHMNIKQFINLKNPWKSSMSDKRRKSCNQIRSKIQHQNDVNIGSTFQNLQDYHDDHYDNFFFQKRGEWCLIIVKYFSKICHSNPSKFFKFYIQHKF